MNQTTPIVTFLAQTAVYLPPEEQKMVERAVELATVVHQGKFRRDGSPYVFHPVAVATTLANWHAPSHILITALLHDAFKTNYATPPDPETIRHNFGESVFNLIKQMTRLGRFGHVEASHERRTPDSNHPTFEPIPWAAALLRRSPLAVIVKIVDRLHNFQSLAVLPPERQKAFADRALRVFVPLAERIGMRQAKRALEDAAFQVLETEVYERTVRRYPWAAREQEVNKLVTAVQEKLTAVGLPAQVVVQPKSYYNLYEAENAQHKVLPLLQTNPVLVIVDDPSACYQALGAIHSLWPPQSERFKDYIANPKANGYRALHTRVHCFTGDVVLILIRDKQMHQVAEWGLTAGWRGVPPELLPDISGWEEAPPGKIAIFTPDGDMLILPEKATAIDFAYAVHSNLGHQCIGVRVNGRMSSLDRQLESGDVVRVLTSSASLGPAPEWVHMATTSKARQAIRRRIKLQNPGAAASAGWVMLDSGLRQYGTTLADSQVVERLKQTAEEMGYTSPQDLFIALGLRQRNPDAVIRQMQTAGPRYDTPLSMQVVIASVEEAKLPQRLASCCNPLPPDAIIGYKTQRNNVVIHQANCRYVARLKPLLNAEWSRAAIPERSKINLMAVDRPGLVRDLAIIVSEVGLNMISFHADRIEDGSAEVQIGLSEVSYGTLAQILERLKQVPDVRKVELQTPGINNQFHLSPTRQDGSPYTLKPVSGSQFFGRRGEMLELINHFRHVQPGQAVLLWGPRRIGKTSLLLQFKETVMNNPDHLPIFLDMQRMNGRSTTMFLWEILHKVVDGLQDPRVPRPSLSRMKRDPLGFFSRFLEHTPALSKRHLVLILDEFQLIGTLEEENASLENINRYFRSLIQHRQGLSIIFSGGGILENLLKQPATAFMLEVARYEKLGCLDDRAARQLIVEPARHITYEPSVVEDLLALTARHPYFLQWICTELLTRANREQHLRITPDQLQLVLEEWVPFQGEQYFNHLWGSSMGFTMEEENKNKLVLTTLAHHPSPDRWHPATELNNLTAVFTEQTLTRTLPNLVKMDTLEQNDRSHYRIKIPLFEQWLQTNYTVEMILEEISL